MIRMVYDGAADALMIELDADAASAKTKHVAPGVHVDFDARGRLIGIEILAASFHVPRAELDRLPTGERWLSLKEAAELSERSVSTLRVQLNAGRLPGRKQGRDWVVRETDILNYVENLSPRGGRPVGVARPPKAPTPARKKRRAAR